jgi:hypothetical protein
MRKFAGSAAERLNERQPDSIKDEQRPYNAADGSILNTAMFALHPSKALPQTSRGVTLFNLKRARCYAPLCKRPGRPVPLFKIHSASKSMLCT